MKIKQKNLCSTEVASFPELASHLTIPEVVTKQVPIIGPPIELALHQIDGEIPVNSYEPTAKALYARLHYPIHEVLSFGKQMLISLIIE